MTHPSGQPTPKYPKNRKKNTGFWPLHSQIWRGVESTDPVFKSAGVRTPPPTPRPPVGDAPDCG